MSNAATVWEMEVGKKLLGLCDLMFSLHPNLTCTPSGGPHFIHLGSSPSNFCSLLLVHQQGSLIFMISLFYTETEQCCGNKDRSKGQEA